MITQQDIQHKIDCKTKPLGALGKLEAIALQISSIQQTLEPKLLEPTIFLFAADHGIANDGVSAFPQEVTWQMVFNFLQGGAAINVFSKQHGINVKIVDAGVNKDFEKNTSLIDAKVNKGTKSFLKEKAMTSLELERCFSNGQKIIQEFKETSACNVIGFGEMGIGNTSSASLLMHCFTGIPLEKCIGKGTGLNEEQLKNKHNILYKALDFNKIDFNNPQEVLQTFGGFEIASITAAMLESYNQNLIILVDGFIATASFLAAYKINPAIIKNAIFCHQSNEAGHLLALDFLQVNALINLNMRLGEGTGCAMAYPIIQSAVNFMNQMASFESAEVSQKKGTN